MTAFDARRTFTVALVLAAWAPLLAGTFSALGAQQQPNLKGQTTAVVQDAIRLLESKLYLDFIKKYMRPSELEELVAKFGSPENVAAEFDKQQRAPGMLTALRAALKLEPAFDAEGTRARYTFETPIGGERALTLQKIGDRWYIRD